MQEDSSAPSVPEAIPAASEIEVPYVEPVPNAPSEDFNHVSGIPDAVVGPGDLELPASAEGGEPSVLLPSQSEDANRENDLGSDALLPDIDAHFQSASKKMPKSDRDRLRVVCKLVEKTGLALNEMPLTLPFLVEQIERFGLHERPLTFARSILISWDRLVKTDPILQSLKYETIEDKRVHSLPESEWPSSFRSDLGKWKQSVRVKVPDGENPIDALTARTIKDYEDAAVKALSALRLSGVRLSDNSGIVFLLRVMAVTIWEKVLLERQKPKTVQGTLAGVLRIARDMHVEQSCIEFLEARLAAVMTSPEIDTSRLATLAEPENFLALIEVPELLMLKAEDPERTMFSRLSAGRSAIAFQLMWEHPDLSEQFVAHFNLEAHLSGAGSELTLLRSQDGAPERVTPATAQFVSRFLKVNDLDSAPSLYLFPDRHGQPRSAARAMQSVYHQIQGVLFSHVTRSDLRDLNTFIAVSADDADLAAIAAGAGYKHTKSLALRLGQSAGRPKQERSK